MRYLKVLLFSLLSSPAFSQSEEVGAFFGGIQYQGDLAGGDIAPSAFKPTLGVIYRYNTEPNFFAFRGTFLHGQLYGEDKSTGRKVIRNLSFKSHIFEVTAMTELSINAILQNYWDVVYRRWENRLPYNFYMTGGLSVFYFNPKAEYYGQTFTLHDKETEVGKKYSRIQIGLPFGFGYDMGFGRDRLTRFGIEVIYRKTFTDYLDDLSTGTYPNKAKLVAERKEIDAALSDRSVEIYGEGNGISDRNPGSRRASSGKKDSFYTVCFTITRFINTGTAYR